MNTLNIDVVYYIGKFMEKSNYFYYSLTPLYEDLPKYFNENEIIKYVGLCIKEKKNKKIFKILKYHNVFNKSIFIFYASKYVNKHILKCFLKNAKIFNDGETIKAFNYALFYENLEIIKIFMKYENLIFDEKNVIEIINKKLFDYSLQNERGCAKNVKNFKFYMKNTCFKKIVYEFGNKCINNYYIKLCHFQTLNERGDLDLYDKKVVEKIIYAINDLQIRLFFFELDNFNFLNIYGDVINYWINLLYQKNV